MQGLTRHQRTIRAFLKARTSYDVLPISYRLIVLDTALLVKKILNQNGGRIHGRYAIEQKLTLRHRHRLRATVGLEIVHFCWAAYHL
jgi:hypothetical protein